MKLESNKVSIQASEVEVFKFLSDLNNYQKLFPDDKIENWNSDVNECSFKIKGATTIDFVISEKIEYQKVIINSGSKSPFPFVLTIHIEKESNEVIAYNIFEGKVNPFIKMMVEKPLTNLFNHITEQVKIHFN